jgi:hypothetical protein
MLSFHHFRESLFALNLQASSYNSAASVDCFNFEASGFYIFFKKKLDLSVLFEYDFV